MNNKYFSKYRAIFFGAIFLFIFLVVGGFMYALPPEKRPGFLPDLPGMPKPSTGVTITFWSVYDDTSVFENLIEQYEKNTGHNIEYRKFANASELEKALYNNLASKTGPDIFSLHNTWMPRYYGKVAPIPNDKIDEIKEFEAVYGRLPYDFARKEENYSPSLFVNHTKNVFTPAVTNDLIKNGRIYGLPLSVDSLALYYNEDIFAENLLVGPPSTWSEFLNYTKAITKKGPAGKIKQAGACIGTAENINRSSDILALLMMQQGAQMVSSDKSRATFDQPVTTREGESFNPAARALRFYTDFANPSKDAYNWNGERDWSLDAFAEEECAMMINYSYHQSTVQNKNPRLNFSLAKVPQIESGQRVDYAGYWTQAVSKNSEHPKVAWDFILYLLEDKNHSAYLWNAHRPTPRTDQGFVSWQKQNMPSLKTPASQTATARSWYQEDNEAVERIFKDAIKKVNLDILTPEQATHKAVDELNRIMN